MWDGGDSKAGRRRYKAAIKTDAYITIVGVLRCGRRDVQTELALA